MYKIVFIERQTLLNYSSLFLVFLFTLWPFLPPNLTLFRPQLPCSILMAMGAQTWINLWTTMPHALLPSLTERRVLVSENPRRENVCSTSDTESREACRVAWLHGTSKQKAPQLSLCPCLSVMQEQEWHKHKTEKEEHLLLKTKTNSVFFCFDQQPRTKENQPLRRCQYKFMTMRTDTP